MYEGAFTLRADVGETSACDRLLANVFQISKRSPDNVFPIDIWHLCATV